MKRKINMHLLREVKCLKIEDKIAGQLALFGLPVHIHQYICTHSQNYSVIRSFALVASRGGIYSGPKK